MKFGYEECWVSVTERLTVVEKNESEAHHSTTHIRS